MNIYETEPRAISNRSKGGFPFSIFCRARDFSLLSSELPLSLVSLVEWNVSLGSADVSWGGVRAIRMAAKETITWLTFIFLNQMFTLLNN